MFFRLSKLPGAAGAAALNKFIASLTSVALIQPTGGDGSDQHHLLTPASSPGGTRLRVVKLMWGHLAAGSISPEALSPAV